jgi:hypothetical protein
VITEPFDLVVAGGASLVESVGSEDLVADQHRRLRPDEDVVDPAAVATAPLRPKAVDLSVGDADRAGECSGLSLHPALAREREREQYGDDDQVDAKGDE